ncbi:MAG: hypothetical protein AB7J34_08200 [Limisphaerales bacterium]
MQRKNNKLEGRKILVSAVRFRPQPPAFAGLSASYGWQASEGCAP